MLRYVRGGAQGQEEDTDDEQEQPCTSSSGTHQPQPASRSVDSTIGPSPDQPPSSSRLGTDTQQITTTSESTSPVIESSSAGDNVETCVPPPTDPAFWPSKVLDADRVEIVRRGPFKVPSDFNFPKGLDGRAFHSSLQFKTLSNGEKIMRSWLVYSQQNNAVFCFACKLFSLKAIKLTAEGHSDWSNINSSLRSHECSSDHAQCMFKWRELDMRLQTNMTIDHQALTLLEAEKRSHKEQMSLIVRIVDLVPKPNIKEYFLGYMEVVETTGLNLSTRWNILKKHVNLTVKSWSDVRWESRLKSVTAARSQIKEIRNALIEARQTVNDSVAKIEAQALAEEVASFRFLICSVVWCEILTTTNQVNKLLQTSSMQLDIAVRLIDNAKTSLSRYRHSGFAEAVSTAKELCEAMNIEPELKEKRLRNTKRQFAYETADEPFSDALKILEVTFFNSVVDSALMSLQGRFETMTQVRDKFGVLLDFSRVHGMSKEDLQKKCIEVQKTLTEEGNSDIDGLEMVQEIINLPQLSPQTTALELLTFLHENCLQEVYPNLWVALRVALTLPVTVASAERSFSKLKLIKTYLRSTMGQERLSGLAVISINGEVAQKLSYDDLISDFAARKCRRVAL
ncbi:hypothetical protein PO909_004542 [Leuciscus waleckii]